MALLNDTRTARDNLEQEDDLIRRMNSLESQTLAWIAEATTLYGTVDAGDQSQVLAMRALLISKLTAAIAI